MISTVKLKLRDTELILETGEIAKQANGAVIIKYGDTSLLSAVTMSDEPVADIDYFPLVVNYQERIYAAGKIPGGFIKREGKPTDKEILISRLIDRPIRPLFQKGFRNEVQILTTIISSDQINPPDVFAIIVSSAALLISDIPFENPVGAVRIGKIDDQFIVNPTYSELEKSSLDLVIAGTKKGITMIEGNAKELSEDEMLKACQFAYDYILEIAKLQENLLNSLGENRKKKITPKLFIPEESMKEKILNYIEKPLNEILNSVYDKKERKIKLKNLKEEVVEKFKNEFTDIDETNFKIYVNEIIEEKSREIVRKMILTEKRRIDGRKLNEIRPISCKVGIFPRTHGSALFTRGQTQSLCITTLGSMEDEQRYDDIEGETTKTFMFHYNFPPFSVGETGKIGAPSRREIGHGMLAERSLSAVLPDYSEFPYTIRIVSEILESNGSSSMASVCSGCLSLLDAGVPIKNSVAGIAMGLVYENDNNYAILTDIIGEEDHFGDMDFKIAGTKKGITGFQLDIKIEGLNFNIMKEALIQAKAAREFILNKMAETIAYPRSSISPYAPKIKIIPIEKEKIPLLIGPGGKIIKDIIKKTNSTIFINEDKNIVSISAKTYQDLDEAVKMVMDTISELEVGKVYKAKVTRIVDFGAFVLLPGNKEALLHISNISKNRIRNVEDVLKINDEIDVKVISIDELGRINVSMKDV